MRGREGESVKTRKRENEKTRKRDDSFYLFFAHLPTCLLSAFGICLILSCILFITPDTSAEDYALIIGGVGGEKSFYDEFGNATSRMRELLIEEYGYAPEHITFLFEDGGEGSDLIDGKSTKVGIEAAFADLQSRVQSGDRFLLFMVGHATKTGGGLKFNSPGRDIKDIECAALIEQIPAEQMVLIFGFPYSARLVSQVSKEGRTIITACSAREGYMRSGFGNIFIDAFSDRTADADDNGAISLLEAFLYTQKRVKTWYENDGSVQSEHPHLDDNGDGVASRKELPNASDGTLAQSTYLGKRRSALVDRVAAEADLDRPATNLQKKLTRLTNRHPNALQFLIISFQKRMKRRSKGYSLRHQRQMITLIMVRLCFGKRR